MATKQSVVENAVAQMRAHAGEAADLMKALGNESRLLILCALADGERSVGELNAMVPLSQSALSQQLARLREQGLVQTRRESQTIFYSLCAGPADQVIRLLHDIYCPAPATGSARGLC
jgi:ArsR family transcriptional regulator, virulence genes transcriptional regulator